MNEPGPVTNDDRALTRPVFISYATADRKEALALCKAIERRGTKCWISTRDVAPGDNYQEAIVRSLRASRAMVLVFSDAANNSDEIKKELSLASRYHVPVMALRIEDVEPSDAFAYELSTRQWIDAFESWDKSIDSLVQRIGQTSPHSAEAVMAPAPARRRGGPRAGAGTIAAAAVAVLLLVAAGAWWMLRPAPAAAHSMLVRLTGFSSLSPEIPADVPGAIRDEIIAAFNDEGVVGVSTAPAPPPGTAPAYALGGTIRRDGDQIKVNVRLADERTGATLWSNIFSYDRNQLDHVPRHIAVSAGGIVRCGLFAASTYPKSLPDPVMTDYLNFCHNNADWDFDPGKALFSARKVVAAAPDFSWGWSAVALASLQGAESQTGAEAQASRQEAADAAAKAVALDPTNSEAYSYQAVLADPDLVAEEKLFKKALASRPLACGCEHHIYGAMLESAGRFNDAIDEFRRSTEVLPLIGGSQESLAEALLINGQPDDAKPHIDAAIDLSSSPTASEDFAIEAAIITGDYAPGIKALEDPKVDTPAPLRTAWTACYQAMQSGDSAAKGRAVQLLLALPPQMKGRDVTLCLGALGANREALQNVADAAAKRRWTATSWLFFPSMKGVLSDPSFPAYAQRLGLMRYWRTSHTRPDVCSAGTPPPFCRMI